MRRLYSLYTGLPSPFTCIFIACSCIIRSFVNVRAKGPPGKPHAIPATLHRILIYLDKWEEENCSHVVREMSPRRAVRRAESRSEADRIWVSQQFTPAGAAHTKDLMFHFSCNPPSSANECNKTHLRSGPSRHSSKLRSYVLEGGCASSPCAHLIKAAIVRSQIGRGMDSAIIPTRSHIPVGVPRSSPVQI